MRTPERTTSCRAPGRWARAGALSCGGTCTPQHKGVGPELSQRTVAELPTPIRAATLTELQPALLRLKEQLRDVVAAGHPVDDTQRVIALRGLLPRPLLDRLGGDPKDAHDN